jgi:hypothetical protein
MHTYFVKWHDGRAGEADNVDLCLRRAIGDKEYAAYRRNMGPRGYSWSEYRGVQSLYETATINTQDNREQICQVFRTDKPQAIFKLRKFLKLK